MSKPPPPKQNFAQTLLIAIVVMMGFQLWQISQQKNQPQQQQPSVAALYKLMLGMNRDRMDQSILSVKRQYDDALDALVAKNKMSPAEAEQKKADATVIVADTQLKAGIHGNDTGRLRDAYATLQPLEKQYLDKPIWNVPVAVTDVTQDKLYAPGWNEWTGQSLYTQVVTRLTERNKTELVYGFIPGYQLMDFLVHVTGGVSWYSYAFASFLLAFVVRATVFPLMQKQLMFSRQMSQLVPLTNEIKAKFKDDPQEFQKRQMKLYQEYGINPFQGCLPAFVQMPLFLTVYQCMLRYQFAFQKGTFLWINKPMSLATHGFIAPNLGQSDYILIVIYGITMLISTLLTPISDPSQAKQQRLMSVGITVVFTLGMFTGRFPVVAGFVLYWTFTNILSMAQSIRAYRMPAPPLVKVNAAGGGVYPKSKFHQFIENAQKMQEEAQRKQDGNFPASGTSSKWLATDPQSLPSANPPKKPSDDPGSSGDSDDDSGKHKPKKRK